MTTTTLNERTVTVDGKPIFVSEAGTGQAVVMLHGGGPGASGVSNYSRNIDALAAHFRVIVPDMPGYGRSAKGVDQDDPFGYLADMIRGLLDELGIGTAHLVGNSYGGAAALRLALDTPHRVDKLVLMGPGGIGTTRGLPTAGLKSLLSYYGGDGPEPRQARHVHPHLFGVRRRRGARGPHRRALPGVHRPGGDRGPAAAPPVRPAHPVADGSHARPSAEGAHDADAGAVGPRRQGQPPRRRPDVVQPAAQRGVGDDIAHRALDAVGTRELFNRLVVEFLGR